MANRRIRNRNAAMRAKPIEAMYSAAASIITIIIYFAVVIFSAYTSGESPKWLGGVAMLTFIAAFICFIYNLSQMRKKTEFLGRIVCLIISFVAFALWAATFGYGMIS